jgi:nucleotide-binding universal stress UspA family protein
MKRTFRILAAVDFSDASLEAVRWTASLARRLDAEVTLLSVFPKASEEAALFWGEEGLHRDRLAHVRAREDFGAKSPDLQLRAGDPVEEILLAARQYHSDLIVMGTHGRSGLLRAVLGSVAEGVLRRANCPVVAVRGGIQKGPDAFLEPDEAAVPSGQKP